MLGILSLSLSLGPLLFFNIVAWYRFELLFCYLLFYCYSHLYTLKCNVILFNIAYFLTDAYKYFRIYLYLVYKSWRLFMHCFMIIRIFNVFHLTQIMISYKYSMRNDHWLLITGPGTWSAVSASLLQANTRSKSDWPIRHHR